MSLADFSRKLAALPRVVAIKVAAAAAPALTAAARATFDAGEDAFGASWAPGADGESVTLKKTGAMARDLTYVANGTKIRVKLGVDYAKYQLGKRPAFPKQGEPLPASYTNALEASTAKVIAEEVSS